TDIEPRLLKFEPGLAFPPSPRKPLAVVPWNVELEYTKPPLVAEAPGAQATPKQPLVKPAMKTSSAFAVPWPAINIVKAPMARTRLFIVIRISDVIMWTPSKHNLRRAKPRF